MGRQTNIYRWKFDWRKKIYLGKSEIIFKGEYLDRKRAKGKGKEYSDLAI